MKFKFIPCPFLIASPYLNRYQGQHILKLLVCAQVKLTLVITSDIKPVGPSLWR